MPGFYFSDAGAWDLIADKIDAGYPYQEIILTTPAGASALTMSIVIDPARLPVYIKLQVGHGNRAIARSFHYADF